MTDTDTTTTPEATAPVKHALTELEAVTDAYRDELDAENAAPKPEGVDYFATYDQLKAGETLQLLKLLDVEESALARTGTAQLLAVVWKHQRLTLGTSKMSQLVDLTENELLAELNLTPAQYVEQVTAYIEAGSKS